MGVLGLEESYGYLVGTHARDKDAVSAAMMIAEACAYFKGKGKTLYQVLQERRLSKLQIRLFEFLWKVLYLRNI